MTQFTLRNVSSLKSFSARGLIVCRDMKLLPVGIGMFFRLTMCASNEWMILARQDDRKVDE